MTTTNVLNDIKIKRKRNSKTTKIGLFGFGCVGRGIYELLEKSTGIDAEIVKIGVKNKSKKRSFEEQGVGRFESVRLL